MRTIGFDIDGVLYDFQTAVFDHLTMYHKLVQDYTEFWREERDNRGRFSNVFWENIIKVPILYELFDMSPSDLDVLNTLSKDFKIIYVTHRPKEVKFTTEMWFKRNELPYKENLYFAGDKSIPILENQCEYFIDDSVHVIEKLQGITNAILRKRQWHTEEHLKYPYISSLSELLEMTL